MKKKKIEKILRDLLKEQARFDSRIYNCEIATGIASVLPIKMVPDFANVQPAELTELPEKWCVLRNEENALVINEWGNKISGGKPLFLTDCDYIFLDDNGDIDLMGRLPDGYTEISFADFKRLVLKEGDKEVRQVGKWYKTPEYGKSIYFVTDIDASDVKAYGFDSDGNWLNESWGWTNPEQYPTDTPATEEEVKSALITEAEGRYKKDSIVDSLGGSKHEKVYPINHCYTYKSLTNQLRTHENCCIFFNGKWATIIDKPKEIDWSLPGQLVSADEGLLIVMTTETSTDKNGFKGVVLKDDREVAYQKVGSISTVFSKECFTLHTEPVTLQNQ